MRARKHSGIVLFFYPAFSPAFYVFYIAAGLPDMLDGFVAGKTDTVSKPGYDSEGMALGMCFGVAMASALHWDIGFGLTLGLLLGLVIGSAIKKKKDE